MAAKRGQNLLKGSFRAALSFQARQNFEVRFMLCILQAPLQPLTALILRCSTHLSSRCLCHGFPCNCIKRQHGVVLNALVGDWLYAGFKCHEHPGTMHMRCQKARQEQSSKAKTCKIPRDSISSEPTALKRPSPAMHAIRALGRYLYFCPSPCGKGLGFWMV